jgi:hypothetical protein
MSRNPEIVTTVLEKVSWRPNKMVFYNEFSKFDTINQCVINRTNSNPGGNNLKKFHNFEISENARREIQNKIHWLYSLSKKRNVKTIAGNSIFNFKMGFITVTLPSSQIHSTAEITKTCFNQFLTELRQHYGLENYIWRLEFQKNGNLHYHLATDCYIDYHLLLKCWNRCIDKLGYVKRYREKMKSLSLLQYRNLNDFNKKAEFSKVVERYSMNVKNGWINPPSVDVKSATSEKKIAAYIAKYFGKKEKSGVKCSHLDNEENSFSLRLWFCSRSLSKMKSVSDYVEKLEIDFKSLIKSCKKVKEIICDYCIVYYYDFNDLTKQAKQIFTWLLEEETIIQGYRPAT